MPDVNGSIRGQGAAAGRVRVRAAPRDRDDRPAARARPDRHTDHRLRARSASARAPATSSSTRIRRTLRELTWRPGWRICLCTPAWPDGQPCELSSREALRGVLEQTWRARLRGASRRSNTRCVCATATSRPLSSGLSYSLSEVARFEHFVRAASCPPSTRWASSLSAVHTEAGRGCSSSTSPPARVCAPPMTPCSSSWPSRRSRRRSGCRRAFWPRPSPGEEGSSGHVHLSCWADGSNAFGPDDPAQRAAGAVRSGDRRRARAPARRLADAQPDDQLLQAARPRLVRARQRELGTREPILRGAAPCAVITPSSWRLECRRPGADANPYLALGGARRLRRGRHPARGAAAGAPSRATPPNATICRRCRARSRARSARSTPTLTSGT